MLCEFFFKAKIPFTIRKEEFLVTLQSSSATYVNSDIVDSYVLFTGLQNL